MKKIIVKHLCQTKAAQQIVTELIATSAVNFVTPKAATKHDLLFNKPASEVGLLNT
jgi:hypothetical protein